VRATTKQPTETVTEVVSEALEKPVDDLPPLSRVIDPDALNRLVSSNTSTRSPEVTVIFEYASLKVVIHSQEVIYARPIDDGG
jgi:hypothetical protein